jgi:hypothetical protein
VCGAVKRVFTLPSGRAREYEWCGDTIELCVCPGCEGELSRNRMPPFAIANGLAIGLLPIELRDLTSIEIALVRTIAFVGCDCDCMCSDNSRSENFLFFYPQHDTISDDVM